MGAMASQITSLTIVYSTVYSGADKKNKLRITGLCPGDRWPVNSPHKWPVTRKMFPFDDVIMFIIFYYFILIARQPWWYASTSTKVDISAIQKTIWFVFTFYDNAW